MTLVATSVGLLTYFLYKKMKYRSPPGPWSIPLIGHWKLYTIGTMHREVAALSKQYGPVIQLKMGPTPVVVLNNLEVVIEALVKKSADFSSRPRFFTGELFSQNGKDIIFGPYSATWKFHKKVAGKALRYYMHGEKLENMINDVCERIFERMSKEQDPFSVTDYIDKLVIHMLFNMCFARKCDLDDPDVERLLKIDTEVIETFGNGLVEDLVPAMSYVYKTQRCKRVENMLFEALSFLKKELNQHEETFDPSGYDVQKDTMVFINHWALHNDSSYWKDVDKFNPYRYLTKEGKMDMKPENWMPFSAGRRVCLGEPVARTELLLIASNLLQNFRFKAPPGVTHVPGMRCPTQGTELPAFYKVVVERRTQS
ncbi:hypothetical protein FSP39_011721 [Pinctada imbricata]|uniref:Uncharacterized protein n=1 Tax=Pinctada imbricata TaxID=66713 RepID=A0AA88YEE0_PINIB|nr:hypothetical protein FSP39_011721 [Pinctada imbricata]